jgi:hypothetical protein
VNFYASIRRSVLVCVLLLVGLSAQGARAATTILPPGLTCFTGNSGPASNGSLNMFQPNTSNPKPTYQDPNQATLNSQPISLDANGCATIYGVGSYRQQLYDGPVVGGVTTGNQIFDKLTTDTSAFNAVFWAGLAAGTPNAITVVDTGFNGTDGSVIQFIPVSSNSGPTTLNPSGFGAISIVKDTTTGAVALAGGEIVASSPSNIVSVVYSASQANFHLLNLVNQSAAQTPQTICGAIGLKLVNDTSTPNSKVDVTADQITMITTGGFTISRTNVSFTLNFTINGANGLDTGTFAASNWYNIWVVDNGSTGASLGSLSATAPTLPSGYSYKCRLGAVLTDGSIDLLRTIQLGNQTQYQVTVSTNTASYPLVLNSNTGTFSSLAFSGTAILVAPFIPPTATRIKLMLYTVATSSQSTACAPNNSNFAGYTTATPPPLFAIPGTGGTGVSSFAAPGELILESNSIYCAGQGTNSVVRAIGWTDRINAN